MFEKMKFKTKLFIIAFVILPAMIVSIGYFAYRAYWLEVVTSVSGLMNFVDAKQQGVIRFIGQNEKLARELAQLVDKSGVAAARNLFASIVATDIFKVEDHPFKEEILSRKRVIPTMKVYHAIDYVKDGVIKASSDPAREGKVRTAQLNLTPGYSNVYMDGDKPVFTTGAPTKDGGMVYVHIDAMMLTNIVNGEIGNLEGDMGAFYLAGVGKTFDYYIVDENNRLITESRTRPGQMLKGKGSEYPYLLTQQKASIDCGADGTYRTNAKVTTGCREAMGFYEGVSGKTMLGASMPFYDSGWTIVVEQEADELLLPFWDVLKVVMGVGIIALTIVLAIILRINHSISRQLKMLAKAAEAIANGDYTQRPVVKTNDEISKLAHSFSQMAESIENSHRELESRKRFTENIVATVPSALIVIGEESKVISVNKSFCELFGLKCEQVEGQPVDGVLRTIGFSEDCRAMVAGQQAFHNVEFTCSIPGKKGILTLQLTLSGIRLAAAAEAEEEQQQQLLVIDDITERVRFEKELAKSKSYTESIIKNFLDTLIVVDTEARIKTVNPETCSLLGYTEEELVGQPVRNIFAEEEEEEEVKALFQFFRHRDKSSLVAGMEIRNVSLTYVTKDGRKIPMSFNASLLTDDQGNITGVVAGAKDITDIKRAEEALRSSEERYRTLFEESKDVVFISTPEGRFIDINPAGVELFGYDSKEELLKADIPHDLYWNPEKREEYEQRMRQQGYVQDMQLEMKRKDGKKLTVLETATAVRDKDDNIVAHRGFIRDITAQKVLEEQFRQAQKMESLGTLAGGIAHDFNNILAIILGHSTHLQGTKVAPDTLSRSIDAITKATSRGASLVKQLLTFARKTEAIFETVDVNNTITEIENLLRGSFPKTIVVCTELQEGLSPIYADATQIHQVLLNLCVNARDAMPRGGTLSISTKTLSGESLASKYPKAEAIDYVEIRVSDTGMGMDEATRQRIFEPFFTTKEVGKGTGLGLSVVYSVVEQHNGFLSVESEPGKGTTFTVYLPVEERAPESFQPLKEAAEEVSGGTETILVVEDEEMLRELLKTVLVTNGYTVLTADDGEQGLEVFRSHQEEIAVVVLDMGLPRLGGKEAFSKIRALNPQAKVIVASGFIDPDTKSEMHKAGAKYFIQKPYLPREVLQRIRDVIEAEN